MAQLISVKLPDGRVYNPSDWTTAEPLYSTVEVGAGPFPVLTAFSYSHGGTVPGSAGPREALLSDTNLEGEGNRLPENEELICYNLSVEVFKDGVESDTTLFPDPENPEVPLTDMLRLQRDLLVIFKIAFVKEYTRAPLSYFPAGTGVNYATSGGLSRATAGASGTARANNGGTSPADMRVFASPLYVAGGESLSVDIKAGPGQVNNLNLDTTARMRLRIFLDGYRRRPVA
jgi:hypothetical protein